MTVRFLSELYRGVTGGFVELRTLGAHPSVFLALPPLDGLDAHVERLAADSALKPYFGVAVRREPTHGRTENCCAVSALWADIDFKSHDEITVQHAVAELAYRPSYVVLSGGGVHLYWLLDGPLTDTARAARLVKTWADSVPMSDPMALAGVLRIPGTLNHKYTPPRRSQIVVERPDRRYRADDLEAHARQVAFDRGESVPEAGVIAPAFVLPESVGQGERHNTLFRFVRSVQSRYALTLNETLALVRAVNQDRFSPPMSEHELRRDTERAFRAPDRAGFERPVLRDGVEAL